MGLSLRIARADLVRAMAAAQGGAAHAGFALHGIGDGWLASPHFALREPGTPDLVVAASPTGPSLRGAPWVLAVATDTVRLHRPDAEAGPVPDHLAIAGCREQLLSLRADDPPATPPALADRYSRTAGALSRAAWDRLAGTHIVLVGCSRTGAPLARLLTRSGVGRLSLVDPDRLEAHNLDALGHPDDLGGFKTEVLGAELTATATRTVIDVVRDDIASHAATRLAASADIIISCVDNPDARQVCAAIAAAMLRTHLDVGTGVFAVDGERSGGIDIRILGPGDGCMVCVGGLAAPPAGVEGLFSGRRIGSDPGLNHIAAGQAYRELARWFSSDAAPRWTSLEDTTLAVQSSTGPRPGCRVCRSRGRGWPGLHQALDAIGPSSLGVTI